MLSREDLLRLVDYKDGYVASAVHFDPRLHELEAVEVFGRTWLVVGHEDMIPKPGDFVTNYMGEVPVIITRSRTGAINVLVNRCSHRGNEVCLFDRGNARGFSCSYHGWSYGLDGSMLGAPYEDVVYVDGLDKASLGLKHARAASFHGLIFATFDPRAPELDEWLSPDVQWWLENFVLSTPVGGLEMLPGWHRYASAGNWKLASENFTGDNYHVWASTHVAMIAVQKDFAERGIHTPMDINQGSTEATPGTLFDLTAGAPASAPLGIGVVGTDDSMHNSDLRVAARLGREAVDWLEYRRERYRELTKEMARKPQGFWHGLMYPNLGLMGFASHLSGRHFLLFHPRGVEEHEFWQWTMVEREAPQVVKEIAVENVIFGQHMAGIVAPDDVENMERIVDASRAPSAWRFPFHYGLKLGREVESDPGDLPGTVVPNPSEFNQRRFYQHWMEEMLRGAS
jgi:phenylpropionate dioxygenase-like ring-hydroxylating dioxygenase large terminal subunit